MWTTRGTVSRNVLTLALVAAVGLSSTVARADVVVVDPRGGDGVTLLDQSIDDAQDGDILLLRAGDYTSDSGSFFIVGKGLTIVNDSGAPLVTNGFGVSDMPLGSRFVLRGVDIVLPATNLTSTRLRFFNLAGDAWIEDCEVVGRDGAKIGPFPLTSPGGSAADIVGAGAITFVRCTLVGGDGNDHTQVGTGHATDGGHAIALEGADIVVYDCTLIGGQAGDGENPAGFAADGGHGVFADNSGGMSFKLIVSGSSLTGGDEGDHTLPGRGGLGLESHHFSTSVWMRDSVFVGGQTVGTGTPGVPFVVSPGTVLTFRRPHASLSIPSPLREGEASVVSIRSMPGDTALALVALDLDFVPLAVRQGALLLDARTLVGPLFVGTVTSPTGEIDIPFLVPALPIGIDGLDVFVQLVVAGPNGTLLGDGTVFSWVDRTF